MLPVYLLREWKMYWNFIAQLRFDLVEQEKEGGWVERKVLKNDK